MPTYLSHMHVLAQPWVLKNQSPKDHDGLPERGFTFFSHGMGPQNDGHGNYLLMGQAKVCDSKFAIIVNTRICICGQGSVDRCNDDGVP